MFHANVYHGPLRTLTRRPVRLSRRLEDWLSLPEVDASTYECTECGVILEPGTATCPDCGGDVESVEVDPRYLYWDPMM